MAEEPQFEQRAHEFARIASEGFKASAGYFRDLPSDAWSDPTGCSEWDMRTLAGHIVGEAVWFPNLVRGVTRNEAPLPAHTYEDLKTLPPSELAATLADAATEVEVSVGEASLEQLQEAVDMGFTEMPIWMATYISMLEAVLHNWDARAGRDPNATVPTEWAVALAGMISQLASQIARQKAAGEAPGSYLLQVSDSVGPVTIVAGDGGVSVQPGSSGAADTTLYLDADQYVRLITGRFPLASAVGSGRVRLEGNRDRAAALNRIFAGIANG